MVLSLGTTRSTPAGALHGVVLGIETEAPGRPSAMRVSLYRKDLDKELHDHEIGYYPMSEFSKSIVGPLRDGGRLVWVKGWTK
jgi:hypothetical protein